MEDQLDQLPSPARQRKMHSAEQTSISAITTFSVKLPSA
jgi:hypothetical protein